MPKIQEFALGSLKQSVVIKRTRPKNLQLAGACKGIVEALELVEQIEMSTQKRKKIRQHLGWAMTSAFQGRTNQARNALVVSMDLLTKSQGVKIPLVKPAGVPAKKLKDLTYYDKRTRTDLWDTLRTPVRGLVHRPIDNRAIAKGVMLMRDRKVWNGPMAKAVSSITDAAIELNPRIFLQNRLDDQVASFDILVEAYANLPSEWQRETLPTDLFDHLNSILPGAFSPDLRIDSAAALLEFGILLNLSSVTDKLDGGDFQGAEELMDKIDIQLGGLQYLVEYVQAAMSARDADVKNIIRNSNIWDLISECTYGNFKERFENSLDDYWGLKKYAVLALCGGQALLIIYTSAGTMLLYAIQAFVSCFICGMLYDIGIEPLDCAMEIAGEVAECIWEGA